MVRTGTVGKMVNRLEMRRPDVCCPGGIATTARIEAAGRVAPSARREMLNDETANSTCRQNYIYVQIVISTVENKCCFRIQ